MGARNDGNRGRLVGIPRVIDAYFCPTCGNVACDHTGYVDDRRDPDYGRAMCVLACGHMALAMRRRGHTEARCVLCLPEEWLVHVREADREKVRAARAREAPVQARRRRRERIVEAFIEALRPPPPFNPRAAIPLRPPVPAAAAPRPAVG